MKRWGLILATCLSLLLSGFVLAHPGWLQARPHRTTLARSLEIGARASASDKLASEAGWRWRQCQPNHWRACMLQR
jgi:hypothetical protein